MIFAQEYIEHEIISTVRSEKENITNLHTIDTVIIWQIVMRFSEPEREAVFLPKKGFGINCAFGHGANGKGKAEKTLTTREMQICGANVF